MRSARRVTLAVLLVAACAGCRSAAHEWRNDDPPGLSVENGAAPAGPKEVAVPVPPVSEGTPPDPIAPSEPSASLVQPAPQQDVSGDPMERVGPLVFGVAGLRAFAFGTQVAPNGATFHPLFAADLNFNLWLWRTQGVYLYEDSTFWGQRAGVGITNPSQGAFDFSKRELDQDVGIAWNYYGRLEARVFAYSYNNLNRGASTTSPIGFKDGAGVENRLYIGGSYPNLGRPGFDVARANFVSLGYYPTKEMVGVDGDGFRPGLFTRAYLTYDLFGPRCYAYGDVELLADRNPKLRFVLLDVGVAVRPFPKLNYLEFRIGSQDRYDVSVSEWLTTLYGAIRFIF
jgi:hypothetical protein